MDRIIVIVIILAILTIGLISILVNAYNTHDSLVRLQEYRNEFVMFANDIYRNEFNMKLYTQLQLKSARIQHIVDNFGTFKYKPAFANYYINNYQIIINSLTEIRNNYSIGTYATLGTQEIDLVDNVLLTCIGAYSDTFEEYKKDCKNPFIWLRNGIWKIVSFPISLIYWGGLIGYNTYNKIISTFLFKTISFIIGFIGVLSSIVTIISGKEALKQFINSILNR